MRVAGARWMFAAMLSILAAAPSAPALSTSYLQDLRAAVETRTASTDAEDRALALADALLKTPTTLLSKDIAVGRAVGRVLGGAFPADPEFEGLLADAASGFLSEVEGRRESLAALAEAMTDMGRGKPVTRSLGKADAALAAAGEAADARSLLRILHGAQKIIEREARRVGVDDREWLVAIVDGRLHTSRLSVGGGFSLDGEFKVITWSGRNWNSVARDNFQQITIHAAATGVGTYPLVGESYGEFFSCNSAHTGRYGCGGYSTASGGSGTLVITRSDGDGHVEGTFEFTVDGSPPWPEVQVTHGRFRFH